MTVVTGNVKNIAGVNHTAPVMFVSPTVRVAGDNIVTEYQQPVKPVNGVISADLQPGPCVMRIGGQEFGFSVPSSGGPYPLKTLITAALGIPANTPDLQVAQAVTSYLELHPISGGGDLTKAQADASYAPQSGTGSPAETLTTATGRAIAFAVALG